MAYIDHSHDLPAYAGGARVEDYFELLKPRVMSLVIFTALVGIVMAPGHMHPVMVFTALLCIAVGAGATTLEWTLSSPPPFHQFETLPKID